MKPADYHKACIEALNPNLPSDWEAIAKAYQGRAYHNLNHLEEMLGHLPRLSTFFAPAAAPIFGIALIYHDIVYRAGRKDNEARSADQAVAFLQKAGAGEADQTRCRQLIMATKTHEAATEEEAVLVDLDLAVLAREATGYDQYARNVRKEFRLFPDFLYRPGRKKALRHFLEKPYIYHGEIARELWEVAARKNLKRELNTL
jgi:predicted metal-dependent HD superfamily phosphohydrolase